MAQLTITDLLVQADRLGVRLIGGPAEGEPIRSVEVIELDALGRLAAGTLAIVSGDASPAPYLIDVAVRQASALKLSGIIFSPAFVLAETAGVLALRGEMPLLVSTSLRGTDLAVAIDRVISGGAAESMTRAAFAIERAVAFGRRHPRSGGDSPGGDPAHARRSKCGVDRQQRRVHR